MTPIPLADLDLLLVDALTGISWPAGTYDDSSTGLTVLDSLSELRHLTARIEWPDSEVDPDRSAESSYYGSWVYDEPEVVLLYQFSRNAGQLAGRRLSMDLEDRVVLAVTGHARLRQVGADPRYRGTTRQLRSGGQLEIRIRFRTARLQRVA